MPAPVTTMIFLHLATAKERFESDLLMEASEVDASRSSVCIIANVCATGKGDARGEGCVAVVGGSRCHWSEESDGRLTRMWLQVQQSRCTRDRFAYPLDSERVDSGATDLPSFSFLAMS